MMNPATPMNVTLAAAEWQVILNALYQRPYAEVKSLVDTLAAQLAGQQTALEEATKAPAKTPTP